MAATAAWLLPLRGLQGPQTTPLKPISPVFRSRRCPHPNRFLPSRSPPARAAQSASASPSPAWDREEARWLREEQRWLREEQRWLREESRWNAEREALLREIAALRLRIEGLEQERLRAVVPNAVVSVEALLGELKDRVTVAEGGARGPPDLVEEADVKEMVLEEIRVSEAAAERKPKEERRRKPLRKGAEGEDVRAMQAALQRLGFYSGEEDMEFASFSSGTERAVKTWQASLGAIEDGVMSSELLERLFMELEVSKVSVKKSGDQKGDFISATEKDGANGAAITSVTGFTEFQQTVIEDDGVTGVEVSEHKVFLLGENRWEEPSRLVGRDNLIGNKAVSTKKCLSCRGEGRLMCTECDGTGEPNIEPQFLEWVDEGAMCPYCEGLGYTICDVCEGKTVV